MQEEGHNPPNQVIQDTVAERAVLKPINDVIMEVETEIGVETQAVEAEAEMTKPDENMKAVDVEVKATMADTAVKATGTDAQVEATGTDAQVEATGTDVQVELVRQEGSQAGSGVREENTELAKETEVTIDSEAGTKAAQSAAPQPAIEASEAEGVAEADDAGHSSASEKKEMAGGEEGIQLEGLAAIVAESARLVESHTAADRLFTKHGYESEEEPAKEEDPAAAEVVVEAADDEEEGIAANEEQEEVVVVQGRKESERRAEDRHEVSVDRHEGSVVVDSSEYEVVVVADRKQEEMVVSDSGQDRTAEADDVQDKVADHGQDAGAEAGSDTAGDTALAAAREGGLAATQGQIEAQAGEKAEEEASEAEEVKIDIGAGVGEEVASSMADPGRLSPAVESDNADTSAGAEGAERAEGERSETEGAAQKEPVLFGTRLMQIFWGLDENGSGLLELEELRSLTEHEAIFNEMDLSASGQVSLEEFVAFFSLRLERDGPEQVEVLLAEMETHFEEEEEEPAKSFWYLKGIGQVRK